MVTIIAGVLLILAGIVVFLNGVFGWVPTASDRDPAPSYSIMDALIPKWAKGLDEDMRWLARAVCVAGGMALVVVGLKVMNVL